MTNDSPLFSLYTPGVLEVNWVNAFLLCLASRHAYYPMLQVSAKQTIDTLHKWGLFNVTFISKHDSNVDIDTQCFTCSNSKVIYLVFRGTEADRISDFVTDAKIRQRKYAVYKGKVHRGFAGGVRIVWPDILLALQNDVATNGDRPICVAGHSLGGALATLASYRIYKSNKFTFDGLYTYGCPKVGDPEFSSSFSTIKKRIFRFENNNDIVPKIPPKHVLNMHWKHVCLPDYFHHDGRYEKDPRSSDIIVDRVLGGLQAMAQPGIDGIQDHGLKNYAANIKKQIRQSKTKNRLKAPWSNYWS